MPKPEIRNPVYPGYFSDPFVWKQDGKYYAFGGGQSDSESTWNQSTVAMPPSVFPVLESADLVNWIPRGQALRMLDPAYGSDYWAPEIAFINGSFWMYYSIGFGDKGHHLRVAKSTDPAGQYVDTGNLLTNPFSCPFAIDPSPFQDDDGTWYLFYARDFLDNDNGARTGTGIVVDRLLGPTKLAGEPRVVLRACRDWQLFMKSRIIYGAVYDWYTLEGPCVRKRKGRYWCLYSAGRWENDTYGIDYAASDQVLGPYVTGDNLQGPRLLRSMPGAVTGPGHNSLVLGPDGIYEYIVYHAWDVQMSKRQMWIEQIEWTQHGPQVARPESLRRNLS